MATDSGTTFYIITPAEPMACLEHGDHFVLVPDINSTHDVRVTIDSCGGDFPLLRWEDKSRAFVALSDDFLVKGVATGIIWNDTEGHFVVDAQAMNIHGFEWLIVGTSTTVGKGTARLLFIDYGVGTVTCDLTEGRQFSTLYIHNGGVGGVSIRANSIGATAAIYRKGILVTADIALGAGETVQFACFEEDKYTLLITSSDSLPDALRNIDNFLGLTDTPGAYTDDSYKILRVNVGETAVEFSAGVNDQTTQDTVFIADALLKLGPLAGGYSIAKRDNKSYMVLSGGTGLNSGFHLQIYGDDAGSPSYDADFRTGAVSQLKFDYSFKTWNFRDNEILGQNGFTINGQTWPAAAGLVGQVLIQTAGGQLAWGGAGLGLNDTIIVAASDEESEIVIGGPKATFRAPFPMSLSYVRISLTTAPTGADFIVNVKMNGTTIFSTQVQIDDGDKTSVGSTTPMVFSVTTVPDDAEFEIFVTQVGVAVAGTGLKVSITGLKTA